MWEGENVDSRAVLQHPNFGVKKTSAESGDKQHLPRPVFAPWRGWRVAPRVKDVIRYFNKDLDGQSNAQLKER